MPRQHRSCPARFVRPALALALGGGLGAASTASADVVASGMVNINIPSTESGIVINLVTGESATSPTVDGYDFQFKNQFTLFCDGSFDSPSNAFVRGFNGASGVNNLPLGTLIGPKVPSWISSSTPTIDQPAANWILSSGDNYVGVRFTNEATGALHYGWIRFCVAEFFGAQPRSIVEYAYESTPNTAIAIGAGGTGMPANCGGAPTCATIPACGDSVPPPSDTVDCVTLEATTECTSKLFYRDHDWRTSGQAPWRNTTWAGPSGGQVGVTLSGFNPDTFEPDFFELTVETLTLRNVDMDPDGFTFRLRGDQTAIDLDNARLVCVPEQPVWDAPVPLSLSATGGDSGYLGMQGLVGSPTTLSVAPGASLKFDACGQTGFGLPNSVRCYFSNSVNHADVDGGTLELFQSYVIFRTGSGKMRVHNGGVLRIFGAESTLETGALEVENASIQMGLGGAGIDVDTMLLDGATVTFEPSSKIVSDLTTVRGTTTIDTDFTTGVATGLTTAIVMDGPGAHLILAGDGTVSVDALFMDMVFSPNPKVTLTEFADLEITDSIGSGWDDGTIEILGENSALFVREDAFVTSRIPIVNEAFIEVEGVFVGSGAVSGSGLFELFGVEATLGILGSTGSTLQIDGPIVLNPFSKLAIELDPQQDRSQRLIAGSEVVMGTIGAYLDAFVRPENDVVLPAGTKFGILDYPAEDDFIGLFWKDDDSGDLVDGSLLTIGLNTYRLAYVDPAFDPSNPTMVTLTVVGSDSCVADLTHDGMVDGADLSILLQDWGTCPPKGGCPADFNHDGMVDGADLSILLEEWGDCP